MPPEPTTWLHDRSVIELTGEDRLEWLQGQATNDVRPLAEGLPVGFCFCQPTGQLLAVIDAWPEGERILMATARETASAVLERVERMTILEDVAARDVSDNYPVRTQVDEEARIAAGVPKWGADMGPRTLPAELGPDFEGRRVGYAKGCYTGQEVLMRMHARGHTNRTWVGLVGEGSMQAGDAVECDGKTVGTVSSAAGVLAAATLRNEATAEGTPVLVGGRRAVVRTMPIRRPS